jgi:hypothetical protein
VLADIKKRCKQIDRKINGLIYQLKGNKKEYSLGYLEK